jgi:hypothetical protein
MYTMHTRLWLIEHQARSKIKGALVRRYNPLCNHVWRYRGDMLYGCCPSCRHSIKIEWSKVPEENSIGNVAEDSSLSQIAVPIEVGGDKP